MLTDRRVLLEEFGDRFSGMKPVALEEIYWPVFRHVFSLSVKEFISLDVLEEGLLRFVDAGVTERAEAAQFLGCSLSLVDHMVTRLAHTFDSKVAAALATDGASLRPTANTRSVLEACQRAVVVEQQLELLRDSVFDNWIDLGDKRFRPLPVPKSTISARAWLAPIADACYPQISNARSDALKKHASEFGEIVSDQIESTGSLRWVQLRMVLFQSEDSKSGHLLLLNPHEDDQPLTSLSTDFERLLLSTTNVRLYFGDDLGGTGRAFWETVSNRLKTVQHSRELQASQDALTKLEQAYLEAKAAIDAKPQSPEELCSQLWLRISNSDSKLREGDTTEASRLYAEAVSHVIAACASREHMGVSESLAETTKELRGRNVIAMDQMELLLSHIRNCEKFSSMADPERDELDRQLPAAIAGLKLLARELSLTLQSPSQALQQREHEQLQRAQLEITNRRAEIERLEELLNSMPETRHIDTKDHGPILRDAIRSARRLLIVISPWLKMRVLSKYLPSLRDALDRGCEVWIGYGMPPNEFHRDNSDPSALAALHELKSRGTLHLVELGTHEKVLIQDDQLFVTTSFNWLSYDGTDRRESGLVQRGDISTFRDKFLSVLKDQQIRNAAKTPRQQIPRGQRTSSHYEARAADD